MTTEKDRLKGVAIIGMAGRFPGARNPTQLWENLCNGLESVDFFTEEEAIAAGAPPEMVKHPDYVKAWGAMDDIELFDANFFGIPGREAEAMDPQHRHLMEVAASALEDAGVNPDSYPGYIGLISGTGISSYLVRNLIPNALRMQALGEWQVFLGNDKDFMPTRVSYKLNLRGASHSVSSGCSTTMLAVHLACRSLLSYQNDICLAGGANIKVPQKLGYLYQKGDLKSADGHCRAFDAKARGTVFSNGCVVVTLKRLKDAIRDRDHIYGVIKGSAINNDGSSKAGFTAPSVSGQARVIAEAHAVAGFPADTITYMEAHGTGTELGDPIEIKALNRAFRETTDKKQYCAMASIKTNIGHLDNVAGVTGLVKTALCLKNKKLPASLHFESPNPEIDFENSPFYINTELQDWNPAGGIPRRACVSAFGAGGTNGHAVLEEAPELEPSGPSRAWQLLTFSAKTPTALDKMSENLIAHLNKYPDLNFADLVYSLNTGRREFNFRRFVICADLADAARALSENDPERVFSGVESPDSEGLDEAAAGIVNKLRQAQDDQAMTAALTDLGNRWLMGASIDWKAFYAGERRTKVSGLPTYPFEGKRYWVEQTKFGVIDQMRLASVAAETEQKKPDFTDWFYAPSWKLSPLPTSVAASSDTRCWVIFADELGLGSALAERLRGQGREVVVVRTGEAFEKESDHAYFLDVTRPEDYNGMLTEMQNNGKIPEAIVHLWTVDDSDGADAQAHLDSGYASVQCLAQAMDAQTYSEQVQLVVVSTQLHGIQDGERIIPEKAALLGPIQVIPQEMGKIACKSLEIVYSGGAADEDLVSRVLAECRAATNDRIVAYRGSRRWIRGFQPVRLENGQSDRARIKPDGVYLITGGLGGLGFELAKHLAAKGPVKLALIGRTELPPADQWESLIKEKDADDPVRLKLASLQALKDQGASVLALSANVADPESVRTVRSRIERELGPVNGIVHAAGVADVGVIQRRKPGSAENVFAPKIRGTRVLETVFADTALDFFALYSSLASVMGGFGQVSYVAANCFLDAYAQSRADEPGSPVVAINWDAWREIGMATARQTEHLERTGLSTSEGIAAFERALDSGLPRVLVSTYDLETRIRQAMALKLDNEEENKLRQAAPAYPRPEMSVPYVAPRNDLERVLAEFWQDLMGMERVGVEDDFFELGGDSLKGMNLVNRLEKQLDAAFHIDALFDSPNIAGLAVYLEATYPDSVDRILGREPVVREIAAEDRIDNEKVATFRALIPTLAPRGETDGVKNKPAVFVLAPPRSGSTLLRVILAGNPRFFAPPELFLLSYNKFRERNEAFPDKASFWLEGLTRAVMSAQGCPELFAESVLLDWTRRDLSAKEVYAELQSRLGDRVLIDKTPSYAYDGNVLARAEQDFHKPLFIHLKRHPYGMIRSYDAAKMDLLLRQYAKGAVPYNSRQIGELIWLICHQNIQTFLKDVPRERQFSLKFEDMVASPEQTAKDLCGFLGTDYHADMIDPYKERYYRMTDGVRPGAKMLGDMNFHEHQGIDVGVAEKWRQTYKADFLGEPTIQMAKSFGYEMIGVDAAPSTPAGLNKIQKTESGVSEDLIDKVDDMSEEEVEKLLQKLGG